MRMTILKYPPEVAERCEYNVISAKRWNNTESHREMRETFRPAAGPYFDGEGWMLNTALAAYKGCNVKLVEEIVKGPRGQELSGITIYRAAKELAEVCDN